MLNRLARLAVTRPKTLLAATLVLMVAAFVYGSGISERLSGGGLYSVSSESQRAAARGAVLTLALVLAAPFTAIRLNFPDDRSLPATIESRSVGDVVHSQFPAQSTAALDVILEPTVGADQLDRYAVALSQMPHVVAVKLGTTNSEQGASGR
jgi:hypothetical protein